MAKSSSSQELGNTPMLNIGGKGSLKYYKFNGDDSSDEEDDVISYDASKVRNRLEDFNTKNTQDFGHNNLSFIAHAVAIKFLYSEAIQKAYYVKKYESKSHFKIYTADEIEKAISGSMSKLGAWHDHNGNGSKSNEPKWADIKEQVYKAIKNKVDSTEFYQALKKMRTQVYLMKSLKILN